MESYFSKKVNLYREKRLLAKLDFEVSLDYFTAVNFHVKGFSPKQLVMFDKDKYFKFSCSLRTLERDRKIINIPDFILPERVRYQGVGRYIWHVIYGFIPEHVRSQTYVSGTMTNVEVYGDNRKRRDSLWKDLCGYSVGDKNAVFVEQIGKNDGHFKGLIHDPWDLNKAKVTVEIIR